MLERVGQEYGFTGVVGRVRLHYAKAIANAPGSLIAKLPMALDAVVSGCRAAQEGDPTRRQRSLRARRVVAMSARLLCGVLALVVGLVVLVSPAAPADRSKGVVAGCPAGSVLARLLPRQAKYVCLKQGQACTPVFQDLYRPYAFRCTRGRLTRLPRWKGFTYIVDVGGYRLAMFCSGRGAPTVVMESGVGSGGSAFSRVQPKVATTTRFCVYDRAGTHLSEGRKPSGPVPAVRIVDDLHALLQGARIKPPYVLGGWSLGGFLVRLYTRHYPDDVVGLVTLDGTPLGLRPLLPPLQGVDLVEDWDGGEYVAAADAEVAASPSLGARPVLVLTHNVNRAPQDPDEVMWLNAQKQVARLSTSSIFVSADQSGHGIASDQPNLSAEAICQVVAAVRAGRALPACAETPLPRFHATCLDLNSP
jgi:alpha/beta hydrolase fold